MSKLSEAQLVQKDLIDSIRTVVRLRHRIAMRRELNDLEDVELKKFQAALQEGKVYELRPADLLEDCE